MGTALTVIGNPVATATVVPFVPATGASTVARKPYATYFTRPERATFTNPVDLNEPRIKEMLEMHTWKRPGGSKTEKHFIAKYITPLGTYRDAAGNHIISIGEKPTVLWSSHTDTVHVTGGKQKLIYGAGFLSLSNKEVKPECLGADCTVGVWIMRQMILRSIPGLYIFHAFEETGASGSRHIQKNTPELLTGINYAIAFDRKNVNSVITHQFSRCASDEFGIALSAALNTPGNFTCDDTGTFTDTANYVDLVPECTNVSVGYWAQHTANECLDVAFADHLLNRVCTLDVDSLPVKRKPGEGDFDDFSMYYGGQYKTRGTSYYAGNYVSKYSGKGKMLAARPTSDFEEAEIEEMAEVCSRFPNLVARFLVDQGHSVSDIDFFDVNTSYESIKAVDKTDEVLDLTQQDLLDQG